MTLLPHRNGYNVIPFKRAASTLGADGPHIEPSNVRHLDANRWDFEYLFVNPGSGEGAGSRLSIDALPRSAVPKLTIECPTADGGTPIRTHHLLTQRCCYWEFYTTEFAVPKGVVVGKAKASVDLPVDVISIELTTREIVVPVVAPPNKPDLPR